MKAMKAMMNAMLGALAVVAVVAGFATGMGLVGGDAQAELSNPVGVNLNTSTIRTMSTCELAATKLAGLMREEGETERNHWQRVHTLTKECRTG